MEKCNTFATVHACRCQHHEGAHEVEIVGAIEPCENEPTTPPVHPGEILRHDFMAPLGLTQNALAKAIGVTPMRVSEIV
ncbi:hypothetical protein LBMAG56_52450 [Verrucomicrobiota bacterium]|nr:hypothetical protein LBMAG56_52450 [Verrucomicrobiota bacterium]